MDIEGKSILITGAAQGLGAATAAALAKTGARVYIGDVNLAKAEALSTALVREGMNVRALPLDVTDTRGISSALELIVRETGGLDVLINNAGIDTTKPIAELTIEEWDRIVAVNLRGPFVLSKFALEIMSRNGTGHIVNICSTASKRAWPNAAPYHATKWGLLGLSHAMFTEARSSGVKVTALIAGGMRTPFIMERFPDTDPSVLQDPANVAETIRFILGQPAETCIPEVMVIPVKETSWP